MYCQDIKFFIWDPCPLYGGYFYCVLYTECPLREVPVYLYLL